MKKLFLLVISSLLVSSVNVVAETMCKVTGNVEPTLSANGKTLTVKCKNYNGYMVNVQITANVSDDNGNTCQKSAFLVIEKGATKSVDLTICSGSYADANKSGVSISVTKCE